VRSSMARKVERFQEAISNPENFVFIYYYRYSEKRNVSAVLEQLEAWLGEMKTRSGIQPKLIFIHQEIVSHFQEERWKWNQLAWGMQVTFFTTEIWTGSQLWAAANDRHLFKEMLNHPEILKFIYGDAWRVEQKRRKLEERKKRWRTFKERIKSKIKTILQLNKG